MSDIRDVTIYTDGACIDNPGPGGWAAILVCKDKDEDVEKEIFGRKSNTTNNHMELLAVVEGIKVLKYPCNVTIITDSKYVVDSVNKGWLFNWIDNDSLITRPNNKLWRELLRLFPRHILKFEWVKAHNGHPYNERCDVLATKEARKAR